MPSDDIHATLAPAPASPPSMRSIFHQQRAAGRLLEDRSPGGCCFRALSLFFPSVVISAVFKGQTVDEIRTGYILFSSFLPAAFLA